MNFYTGPGKGMADRPTPFEHWLHWIGVVAAIVGAVVLVAASITGIILLAVHVSGWWNFLLIPLIILVVGSFTYWVKELA
jgi:hypothetical protein